MGTPSLRVFFGGLSVKNSISRKPRRGKRKIRRRLAQRGDKSLKFSVKTALFSAVFP
jgi:hypothetical protein